MIVWFQQMTQWSPAVPSAQPCIWNSARPNRAICQHLQTPQDFCSRPPLPLTNKPYHLWLPFKSCLMTGMLEMSFTYLLTSIAPYDCNFRGTLKILSSLSHSKTASTTRETWNKDQNCKFYWRIEFGSVENGMTGRQIMSTSDSLIMLPVDRQQQHTDSPSSSLTVSQHVSPQFAETITPALNSITIQSHNLPNASYVTDRQTDGQRYCLNPLCIVASK